MKRLSLDKVPMDYCQAPFWGNGSIGALMYIKEKKLCFSLDQVWLWELRESLPDEPHATYQEILKNPHGYLHDGQDFVEDTNIFHRAYGRTKLPGLTMYMELGEEVPFFHCDMNLDTGIGQVQIKLESGKEFKLSIWLSAKKDVLIVNMEGSQSEQIVAGARGWDITLPALEIIRDWHYPSFQTEQTSSTFAMSQEYSGDRVATIVGQRVDGMDSCTWYVHLATGLAEKKQVIVQEAKIFVWDFARNRLREFEEHLKVYKKFWSGFHIKIPNKRLQQAFYIEMYKILCNERQDSLPITLQGIWNPDTLMPPWFGDLHNDLNVQSSYWAAFKTGNWKLAQPYIWYYSQAVPRFTERAEKLFGVRDAIHIPTMMAPNGYGAAAEWCFWNTLLGPELFVGVDFCWYFEYSQDRGTLREKIIPFLKKVLNLYIGIGELDSGGIIHFPLTQSPEIFDREGMLMRPDSTFAIASLRYLGEKLLRYMDMVKEPEERELYEEFLNQLPKIQTTEKGYPLFPGIELFESHRHLCQMFPVFPLSYDAHSETAARTLNAVIDKGFTEYAAFTFPYLSIMAARCGKGNMCRTMLENYCMAFRSPNSFTVNGDPYGNGLLKISDTNAGESAQAFTLESGLIVPAALCEMFVHRAGDTIYIAAGLPDEWKDCEVRGITVEGGHRVSVKVENYKVIQIKIVPGSSEVINVICDKKRGAFQEMLMLDRYKPQSIRLGE